MLYFEIRVFDKETLEPYGSDQFDDLRQCGSWVAVFEKIRGHAQSYVLKNELFMAELKYMGSLWKSSDGLSTQCLPVKIWKAEPIDSKNPMQGYKETLFIELPDDDMRELGFGRTPHIHPVVNIVKTEPQVLTAGR